MPEKATCPRSLRTAPNQESSFILRDIFLLSFPGWRCFLDGTQLSFPIATSLNNAGQLAFAGFTSNSVGTFLFANQ
ncbi:MAG: hypothetical protein LAO76_27505 [Acidobacteriia bacterium]|jgi:hypothetical protein|nr:hypothetical protein [Terriglobia bacterium]